MIVKSSGTFGQPSFEALSSSQHEEEVSNVESALVAGSEARHGGRAGHDRDGRGPAAGAAHHLHQLSRGRAQREEDRGCVWKLAHTLVIFNSTNSEKRFYFTVKLFLHTQHWFDLKVRPSSG